MRIRLWQCAMIAAAAGMMGCASMKEMQFPKMQMPWQKKAPPVEAAAPPMTSVKPAEAMATFHEGLALLAELHYAQAAVKFQSVVNPLDEAGDRKHASEAFFWLGYCCEKQGMIDKAKPLYQQLVKVYGDTPAADLARQHLADIGAGAVPPAPAPQAPADLEARYPASTQPAVEVK
ncbi:MAG: tetratricopeptide repeat protein [Planctomycetaceae bacterium]|nr:tetratricopeptide repeat protein [Planctomycetaceae bacterium]